jgi:hypothetical protein
VQEWQIRIPDKYPAYISWETFETIQGMLRDNHSEYADKLSRGVPRGLPARKREQQERAELEMRRVPLLTPPPPPAPSPCSRARTPCRRTSSRRPPAGRPRPRILDDLMLVEPLD